ncbi:hypothetical protein D3C71_1943050 [compost metagenome]
MFAVPSFSILLSRYLVFVWDTKASLNFLGGPWGTLPTLCMATAVALLIQVKGSSEICRISSKWSDTIR